MEQIHYRLKARIISYFIAKQKKRRDYKIEIQLAITKLNKSLNSETFSLDEQLEKKKAYRKGINTGKDGGTLSKGSFCPIKTGMGYKC